MVRSARQRSTGTKPIALARKNSSSRNCSASVKPVHSTRKRAEGSPGASGHFAVCVKNDEYPASLELRKLYRVIDDSFAAEHRMVRVIDESGEDYLFPSHYFVRVSLPASVENQTPENRVTDPNLHVQRANPLRLATRRHAPYSPAVSPPVEAGHSDGGGQLRCRCAARDSRKHLEAGRVDEA